MSSLWSRKRNRSIEALYIWMAGSGCYDHMPVGTTDESYCISMARVRHSIAECGALPPFMTKKIDRDWSIKRHSLAGTRPNRKWTMALIGHEFGFEWKLYCARARCRWEKQGGKFW